MIIVFGGTFLIRLLTTGEILIAQLLLAAGGLLLLGISILVRSKDPSPEEREQTLSGMDAFQMPGPDKTASRRNGGNAKYTKSSKTSKTSKSSKTSQPDKPGK